MSDEIRNMDKCKSCADHKRFDDEHCRECKEKELEKSRIIRKIQLEILADGIKEKDEEQHNNNGYGMEYFN